MSFLSRYLRVFDPFDDLAWISTDSPLVKRYELYDTDRYELKPRSDYKKKLVEAKQKEIDSLAERKKQLEQELKQLKEGD